MPLRVTWLLLCLWFTVTAVFAQDADPDPAAQRAKGLTEVIVTVVDQAGKKLPNITVTGAHQGMVFERDPDYTAVTNADGQLVAFGGSLMMRCRPAVYPLDHPLLPWRSRRRHRERRR